jgi:hypothetical protein
MASLRLKFPEKEEPSVLVLSGARVTLGRLPLNTIQIIDRTLSGFHAEFVLEDDHYRLHDRGSTNGTFVNGETVSDFHLREACKISFGGLECEYSPETPAPTENVTVEALPTRSEINGVRQENAEMKNRVDSLREELEAIHKARNTETGSNTVAVAQDEYDKLVSEREALKESQHALQQEIVRLKTDLALLQRDRENLKKVADSAKAEFASFTSATAVVEIPAPALAVEAPAPAAEVPAPAPVALPTLEPLEEKVPVQEAAPAPEPEPLAPPAPVAMPTQLPKPSFPLPAAAKFAPKPPGQLGVPGKLPMAAAPSGVRPVPVAGSGIRPVPTAGGLPKPSLKPLGQAPTPVAKGGTQKISSEAATPIAKPVVPIGKLQMKPPVKLPLQPTVRLQPGVPQPKLGTPFGTKPGADESKDES